MNFIEEMRWRGMIHDIMPGIGEQLKKEMTTGYIGFDPTSDSLHIGNLVQIMILVHFQQAGHKPVALIGGATGLVGDPSGKTKERNLITRNEVSKNIQGIKKQLEKFLDFTGSKNKAELVNNYDWLKEYYFLDFIRDIGKHITINYMLAKDSVQSRLESGLSFTEFSYQIVQGYDFLYLYKTKNCKLQLGGSDQWGNILTGTELIRRIEGGEAFAMTTPLIIKTDGTKFGKTEQGNVWLDANKTSPYKFYQYWLNSSDEDAKNYIRIFTMFSKDEIESMEKEHLAAPHLRLLQKTLAKDITSRVHSEQDYQSALNASEILFGKGTAEMLGKIDETTFLSIFEGVPQFEISRSQLENGISLYELLVDKTSVFPSRNELRRMTKDGGLSINKARIQDLDITLNKNYLINDKYILVQKGKKNYYLIVVI